MLAPTRVSQLQVWIRMHVSEVCLRTKNDKGFLQKTHWLADHKGPQWGVCESRNNHRYSVVVQNWATRWFQSDPCKTKTSQETQKSLHKFLERTRKPKVIYIHNFLEFGKSGEDLQWNHRTSTPRRSETNGIADIAVRKKKRRNVCCIAPTRIWMTNGGLILWNAIAICEMSKTSCQMGKHHVQGDLENPLNGPVIPFGSMVENHLVSAKDQSRLHQLGKKVLPGIFLGCALVVGRVWKRYIMVADIEE